MKIYTGSDRMWGKFHQSPFANRKVNRLDREGKDLVSETLTTPSPTKLSSQPLSFSNLPQVWDIQVIHDIIQPDTVQSATALVPATVQPGALLPGAVQSDVQQADTMVPSAIQPDTIQSIASLMPAIVQPGALQPGAIQFDNIQPADTLVPAAIQPADTLVPATIQPADTLVPTAIQPADTLVPATEQPVIAPIPATMQPYAGINPATVQPAPAQPTKTRSGRIRKQQKKYQPSKTLKTILQKSKAQKSKDTGRVHICFICNDIYRVKDPKGPWVGCKNEKVCQSWAHYKCVGWGDFIGEDVTSKVYMCPKCA
jgi:hypothetical protein